MKTKHYCDICGKDFDDSGECLKHEKNHAKIEKIINENPSKYNVGDRVVKHGGTRIVKILGKKYDLKDGWKYNLGCDENLKVITIGEDDLSCPMYDCEIDNAIVAMNKYLWKNVSKNLYAVYDKDDEEEMTLHIRYDEKLPYAVKLLKTHVKDESKDDTDRTVHAHYFPELDRIVLLEFSTFMPTSNEIGPMMGYAPSKKFPYVINFTLCAFEQYNDVMAGKMKLPDNLDIRKSIDIMGMI